MVASLFAILTFVAPLVLAQADTPPNEGRGRERRMGPPGGRGGPGGGFGGGREEERQQWGERRERYRNASPAERRNLRLEGWVDMTARNYDLNDTEKAVVRQEMETMQAERRALMGPDADEQDRLREKMFEFWNQPREGGNAGEEGGRPDWRRMRDNPEFRELQEKLRALDEKYPFDWQASVERVEKLLPPDKVAKGRARFEERRAQWQNRDGERRGDRGRDRGRDGERRRDRGDRDRRRSQANPDNQSTTPPSPAAEPAKVEAMIKSTKTSHPWEEYVNKFSARYKLDPAQVASAQSILKDSLARAGKLEQDEAKRLGDTPGAKRSAELTAALDGIFTELKGRLDALLTAEQRTKG